MNVGEEIVSAYLEFIKGCEFTQKNLQNPDVQGEIDVIGINLEKKEVFVCEVAIHLETGFQYTKDAQPNRVAKTVDKFSKDIEYARKYFPDYAKQFMLWTPIVRIPTRKVKHDQMKDIELIGKEIKKKYGIDLEFVINERFLASLEELRQHASKVTKELKSPVMRLMQIEERLKSHVEKIEKRRVNK